MRSETEIDERGSFDRVATDHIAALALDQLTLERLSHFGEFALRSFFGLRSWFMAPMTFNLAPDLTAVVLFTSALVQPNSFQSFSPPSAPR